MCYLQTCECYGVVWVGLKKTQIKKAPIEIIYYILLTGSGRQAEWQAHTYTHILNTTMSKAEPIRTEWTEGN